MREDKRAMHVASTHPTGTAVPLLSENPPIPDGSAAGRDSVPSRPYSLHTTLPATRSPTFRLDTTRDKAHLVLEEAAVREYPAHDYLRL